MHQKLYCGRDYEFRWLEERLLPLGFRHILCTRREDSFEEARAERVKVSGKPSQYDDLSIFLREQDLLRELAGKSLLPYLEVDVSDGNIERICIVIADWLEVSGGLYVP